MNAVDQIERARLYREHLANQDRRRSIFTAIALSSATIISIIFLVFAFIQKARADAMSEAMMKMKLATEVAQREIVVLRADLEACKIVAEESSRIDKPSK